MLFIKRRPWVRELFDEGICQRHIQEEFSSKPVLNNRYIKLVTRPGVLLLWRSKVETSLLLPKVKRKTSLSAGSPKIRHLRPFCRRFHNLIAYSYRPEKKRDRRAIFPGLNPSIVTVTVRYLRPRYMLD